MQQKCLDYNDSCSSVIYQSVDVGLPISLTPEVMVGKMKVKCCNEPVITFQQTDCDNCSCEIMIKQTLSYKIPIEYGVKPKLGNVMSDFDNMYEE